MGDSMLRFMLLPVCMVALLQAPGPSPAGTVKVLVLEKQTGVPVDSAFVFCVHCRGAFGYTNWDGEAILDSVPVGTWKVEACRFGYHRSGLEPDVMVQVFENDTSSVTIETAWCPSDGNPILIHPIPLDTIYFSSWPATALEGLSISEAGLNLALIQDTSVDAMEFISDGYIEFEPICHQGWMAFNYTPQWDGEIGINWHQAGRTSSSSCTSVSIQIRTFSGGGCRGFGEWSEPFNSVQSLDDSDLLNGLFYIQIRLNLHTDDPACTPVVTGIWLIRSYMGYWPTTSHLGI